PPPRVPVVADGVGRGVVTALGETLDAALGGLDEGGGERAVAGLDEGRLDLRLGRGHEGSLVAGLDHGVHPLIGVGGVGPTAQDSTSTSSRGVAVMTLTICGRWRVSQ